MTGFIDGAHDSESFREEPPISALTFPTDFPIKIMGEHRDDFAQTVLAVVLKHAPDFVADTMEIRASAQSRYLSVTCTIRAVSREQLDNLYRELTSHPMVRIVL